ncbi:MAG: hypothetical protein ACLGG6_07025 [Gammaproteobacteria bacterium]
MFNLRSSTWPKSQLRADWANMLGRYAFTIPDIVARGELRPLRDPGATGIDDA